MAKSPMPLAAATVTDTSSLIYLLHLELLPKVVIRYSVLYIPQYVLKETNRKGKGRYPLRGIMRHYKFIKRCSVTNELDVRLLYDRRLNPQAPIDRGEAEAIIQARERQVTEVLIDERRGRSVAERHSLHVRGILGLLIEFKRVGVVSEVKPLIDKIKRDLDYRIAEELLQQALAEIGEV